MLPFLTKGTPPVYPGVSQAIGSYFLTRFNFFNPRAIQERKPWNITIGGIEYDDRDYVREQKKRKSHFDAANQRAMDAHQLMSMHGVGIAMQRMH